MTAIKASCPVDGEVELTNEDVTLRVCEQRPALSTYIFECPRCHDAVTKKADQHIVSLLMSARVPVQRVRLPLEALEAKTGDPISYDDLLDFHLALEAAGDYLSAIALRRTR